MTKFFLYARKSIDDEDRQVLSIESQINELREYARKENLEIVDEFTEAKSAKEPGRPIFSFMLKQIEAGYNRPKEVLYKEPFKNKLDVEQREQQIERCSKAKKLALVKGDKNKLINLSRSRD